MRKGQTETIGLVAVVIVIIIVMLIALKMCSNPSKPQDLRKDIEASHLLNAMMLYTPDCTDQHISELIRKCPGSPVCGKECEQAISAELKNIAEASVDNKTSYEINITTSEGQLILLGECKGTTVRTDTYYNPGFLAKIKLCD